MTTPSPAPSKSTSAIRRSAQSHHHDLAAEEARIKAKIARLQSQQRRQKLESDLAAPINKSRTRMRFASAFLIVMAIHVAAIGGFYGVSSIRKMRALDKSALTAKAPTYAGVPEPKVKQTSEPPQPSATANNTEQHETNKSQPNKFKGLVKSPLPPPKQLSPQAKEPSPEIRALFARRHGQKQALAGNAALKEQYLSSQESTAAHEPSTERIHKVTPNETLAQIAKNHGIKTADLRKANGLNDSDDLQVGQKLTIPAPETHAPLQLAEKPLDEAEPKKDAPEVFTPKLERLAPNGVYTVQRGDNPYMVARKLGVSFTDLMTINSISNPADVSIGMKLKVPGNALASN